MHLVASFQRALDEASAVDQRLFVVCDASQAQGLARWLVARRVEFVSLFDRTPEQALADIAPLLLQVDPTDHRELFERLADLAYAAPCISWFRSRVSTEQLAENLRRFHIIGLSEGQRMLLRWYDTRILPVWLACLSPSQAAQFTQGISDWHYVSRMGEVCPMTAEAPPDSDITPLPIGAPLITLSDEQYALLVDAADLDVLLAHLRRIIPDELSLVPAKRLAAFVSRHQQDAMTQGLRDISRQTQYVLLALYTSGKGTEHPLFKAFMKKPPATLDEFSTKLQELPDAVWFAGSPLWETESRRTSASTRVHTDA